MFSQACVKNSVHKGGVHPPGRHPQADTPLGRHLNGRHPMPMSRYPLLPHQDGQHSQLMSEGELYLLIRYRRIFVDTLEFSLNRELKFNYSVNSGNLINN